MFRREALKTIGAWAAGLVLGGRARRPPPTPGPIAGPPPAPAPDHLLAVANTQRFDPEIGEPAAPTAAVWQWDGSRLSPTGGEVEFVNPWGIPLPSGTILGLRRLDGMWYVTAASC